ncbi:DUF4255 domain-containing protein [Micromonospora rubida]|uniref:DUF4255 domain-containing protein n=1 Tax=Micromonospora rubida TaxID=2697657 RepID=A0ABW7SJ60_9ACTN
MSNTLAVAMVTAALRRILGEALAGVPAGGVDNARVTTLRPDMLPAVDGEARGVNILLYEVIVNGHTTNSYLPTRRPDGTLVTRPEQALDLHYLLNFSGDEAALEPQRMLGVIVSTLAAQPVLSRELIRDVIARDTADDPTTWEQYADLADQVEGIRFTLLPLQLDELSKLWLMFPQSDYRLSVVYEASVVLLDRDLTPLPALPVRSRSADAITPRLPSISRVAADSAPTDPVLPGTLIRVDGQRLRGPYVTRVRVDDVETTVPPGSGTDERITLPLPAGVAAGVRVVQVLHPRLVGEPPQERFGAESNTEPVLVRPVVTGPVSAAPGEPGVVEVTVPVDPPVLAGQRVVLILNERHPPADQLGRGYAFAAPSREDAASSDTIVVAVRDVVPGGYLVRLQVDGAQSILRPGDDGRYDTPWVDVP